MKHFNLSLQFLGNYLTEVYNTCGKDTIFFLTLVQGNFDHSYFMEVMFLYTSFPEAIK